MADNDKPGTDWGAKHAAAGSGAQPHQDRPHDLFKAGAIHPVSESDVTTNPAVNVIDND